MTANRKPRTTDNDGKRTRDAKRESKNLRAARKFKHRSR